MDRRDFLKTTGTAFAGATLASAAFATSPAAADSRWEGRKILPLNRR